MVFVLEYDGKHRLLRSVRGIGNTYHTDCHFAYLRDIAVEIYKVIHYRLCTNYPIVALKTVCHDNEQSLCAGTDAPVGLSVNKQRNRIC